MNTIYISHTYKGIYSSQGMSPSGKEGYDIWYKDAGEPEMHFLGWCSIEQLEDIVYYYRYIGDEVAVRLKDMKNFHILSTE